MVDAIEVLVVAFVLDDVAVTFQLGSFYKGLVGSASFGGEKKRRALYPLALCALQIPLDTIYQSDPFPGDDCLEFRAFFAIPRPPAANSSRQQHVARGVWYWRKAYDTALPAVMLVVHELHA